MKEVLIKAAMAVIALLAAGASAPSRAQDSATADGKALFMKNCAACHQASGKGIPGAFPALAGNKFVQGKGADVATVLLKGRGGMPDFSDSLSDQEIAAILSFVRSNWGNQAAPLSEPEVLALRDALQVDHFSNGQMSNKH
ncbi:c-type cytochrome [Duganella violaceipulchra]|uniref:Cytochrome c n=1 Tax=Duganella violaceipulchra TaxID=2849652 RepID=A0AA41H6X0_9BURK|nr:cytochrome c [Duganella violaceicalia]MBV6321554.1 cytochrome c [Duganella violaceicalia]MCP2008187.1 mono/diheme cytochrome c family protein [Duganella violaceicalia]